MVQIDMEMPSCCYDCDFSIGVMSTTADRECTITDKYVNDDDKPEWCPLKEVVTCGEKGKQMKLIDLYQYLTYGQKLHVRVPVDVGTEETFEVKVMQDQRFGGWREEYSDWLEMLDLEIDNIFTSGSDNLMITCKPVKFNKKANDGN